MGKGPKVFSILQSNAKLAQRLRNIYKTSAINMKHGHNIVILVVFALLAMLLYTYNKCSLGPCALYVIRNMLTPIIYTMDLIVTTTTGWWWITLRNYRYNTRRTLTQKHFASIHTMGVNVMEITFNIQQHSSNFQNHPRREKAIQSQMLNELREWGFFGIYYNPARYDLFPIITHMPLTGCACMLGVVHTSRAIEYSSGVLCIPYTTSSIVSCIERPQWWGGGGYVAPCVRLWYIPSL